MRVRVRASVRACASACGGEDTANGCAKELLPSRRRRVAETMALVGVMRAGDNLTNNAKAQRRTNKDDEEDEDDEEGPPSATCHSLRKTRPLELHANKFKQPRCGELVPVRLGAAS